MRSNSLIHLVIGLILLGGLFYLFHQGAQPGIFRANTAEAALSWMNGPDVELNAKSLGKLNAEVRQLVSPGSNRMDSPFRVISLGKRRVEIMHVGSETPSSEVEARVNDYVQKRLPELAREQQPN